MDNKQSFSRKKILTLADKLIWLTFLTTAILTPLFFTTHNTELFEVPKMFIVYLSASIILISTIFKFILSGKISIPKSAVLYSLIALVAVQILSTLTSIDRFTSIFGYPTRLSGGLLSSFAYLIIFAGALINLNFQKAQRLILIMVVAAFVVALWGIPGHFGYDPNCLILTGHLNASCWQKEFAPTIRIFSTLGQPNWLASFMVMMIPLSLALLLFSGKNSRRLPFFVTVSLILALLFTGSVSGILGFAAAIFIFTILIGTIVIRKNLTLFIAATLIATLTVAIFGTTLRSRIIQSLSQKQTANAGTPSLQIRLIVWQGALNAFTARPILGFGPETFIYSYYQFRPAAHNATTEWNFYYNKAHNEFLNYLTNTGILGFGSFLIFIGTALVTLLSSSRKRGSGFSIESRMANDTSIWAKAAIASIIGYLVTIFAGFSIVVTQLFMFLSLAAVLVMSGIPIKTINLKLGNFSRKASYFLIAAFGVWLAIFIVRLYFADVLISRARSFGRLTAYDSAITVSPVQNPFYIADYSYILAVYATSQKDTKLADILTSSAISSGQKSLAISPYNLLILRKVASTYGELASQNPVYKINSLELAQKETVLAPTDPTSYLDLARAQRDIGKLEDAKRSAQKSLSLKPDYQDAKTLLEDLQGNKLQ